MAYPYLPVNPCCTDVVLNSPCGCSSTITNSGCNNNNPCGTNLIASSTIVYNGPALSCTTAEPCDTLNVILQKIDEIICNLLTQINILNIQITNITRQIITFEGDITNIYNQLDACCNVTTTTTSTTIHPCENFSLNNTGDLPVAIIITDCTTQEQEAIVLNPGDTNICVVTDSPLTVPGTVIVTPNGPCVPPTSSTTSTSSTSSTTTTTTTAIPCECLTFYNSDDSSHLISYKDCSNTSIVNVTILANQTINVCGSQGSASDSYVLITIGADCVGGSCIGISTTTTTTTCANCTLPDVTIGGQIWTGCNLDVTTYRNGDPIPQVQDPTAWGALTTGAWCWYNNNTTNGCTYGKLYNAYAVKDPRGIAPVGYHVPSEAEWSTLISYAGGTSVAGGPLKEAGFSHWNSPNSGATDFYGFTGLPGGYRDGFGSFNTINELGYFWTTDYPLNTTVLSYNNSSMPIGLNPENYGGSIRLVKD